MVVVPLLQLLMPWTVERVVWLYIDITKFMIFLMTYPLLFGPPQSRSHDGSLSDPPCKSLIADFSARGVWQPQATALFDVRVIDTDAPSYVNESPDTVLMWAEREKKLKYGRACEDKHATFTPLCISIDGLMGTEL